MGENSAVESRDAKIRVHRLIWRFIAGYLVRRQRATVLDGGNTPTKRDVNNVLICIVCIRHTFLA